MSAIFIFDTETTGLPNWNAPSGDDSQPHIVEIAGLVVDEDTKEIVDMMNLIVKPDGWEIPKEVIDIHGITNEYALDVGVDEASALGDFMDMWAGKKRVAHNTTFDNRIVRIGTKRFIQDAVDPWKAGEYECTARMAKKIMGIGGRSVPSLSDTYMHFFSKVPNITHRAMADARSCMDIYFAIKETGHG